MFLLFWGTSEKRSCQKLRNGQIVILHGGKIYTLQGQEVK